MYSLQTLRVVCNASTVRLRCAPHYRFYPGMHATVNLRGNLTSADYLGVRWLPAHTSSIRILSSNTAPHALRVLVYCTTVMK